MTELRLTDQVIVVTGGTQGLGEAVCLEAAASGAKGIVFCGRNDVQGRSVARAIESKGAIPLFVKADLVNPDDCQRVMEACDQRFGRLHGLVNAAGVTDRGTIDNTTVELWDRIFDINTRAPFILMQEAIRIMKRENHGGSIVNMITMSSHGGQPFITAYSASKGALATLTKNIAHAVRWEQIRVNGINLGWMDSPGEHVTQLNDGNPSDWLESAEERQPFKRLLKPRDIATLAVYLLSDESRLLTGALIDYDQNVMGAYG